MAGTVVGVDIGAAAVRAVEVQGFDGGKPSITKYHELPLPESSVRRSEVVEIGTVTTALRRLWSAGGFKAKDVVLGIGGQRVFARDMSVPRQPLGQIRESLPFLVQDQLPVPVSDVLMDFYPVHEEQGEQGPVVNGLLVAGLKETIDASVNAVLSAGLRPIHVDLVPFAISRAIAPVRSSHGRDVIVSIGANTTNVVVVEDGVPQFVRILPNGGDDVTRALASRMQWSPEQAEHQKRTLGMGTAMMRQEDRPVVEIIYEVVGELLNSIRSTISYFASARPTDPVQRIILNGGGSQLIGLPNALADLMRLPVGLAEPLARVSMPRSRGGNVPTSQQLDAYTTAYGLALGSHA
jgi:type IV pilus assembly protein PilM